jgi:hypothetical protein
MTVNIARNRTEADSRSVRVTTRTSDVQQNSGKCFDDLKVKFGNRRLSRLISSYQQKGDFPFEPTKRFDLHWIDERAKRAFCSRMSIVACSYVSGRRKVN